MLSKLSVKPQMTGGCKPREETRACLGKEETLERRIKRQGYSWRKFSSVHIYYSLSFVRHCARCAERAKMMTETLSLISVAYRGMKREILSETSISFCVCITFLRLQLTR